MSKITDKLIFDLIKQHYRPYDTHREFAQGFAAYRAGHLHNPHEADSISAQAWDLARISHRSHPDGELKSNFGS